MRILLPVLILIIVAASCSSKKKDSVASLKEEVMALHDEAMPKMGELHKTQKDLLRLADSTAEIDSAASQKYRTLAYTIELANESMMDWMREFEPDFKGDESEVKNYLKEEKEKISNVKEAMVKSLEEGKKALE